MRTSILLLGFLSLLPAISFSIPAQAQLNNRPFSFHTPSGGVGMSTGGMQAIINEKVLGVTPDHMVRGSDGSLLDIQKGPGSVAIVSDPGGNFLPGYKGRGWKGDNAGISAGTFNAYFIPGQSNDHVSFDNTYAHIHSGAVVNTWTTRVVSGQPVSFLPGNPVDMWTGAVASLDH